MHDCILQKGYIYRIKSQYDTVYKHMGRKRSGELDRVLKQSIQIYNAKPRTSNDFRLRDNANNIFTFST